MIGFISSHLQSILVYLTIVLLIVYTIHYVFRRQTNAKRNAQHTTRTQESYETPDNWDEETPLCWCDECGAFNHMEYRFCRGCTTELRRNRLVPPQSVISVQQDIKNKQ